MAERKRIALTYYYSENWIAGSYYVANIIKAFNSLDDENKPYLYILFSGKEGIHLLKGINYPYIKFINTDNSDDLFPIKYLRKLSIRVFKKDYSIRLLLSKVDYIFEGHDQYRFIKNHYYWVHDFQQCRMPEFFTEKEAADRSALPAKVAKMEDATLILSSYDALNDFNTFFPGNICKIKVLRFASSLPDFSDVDFNQLISQYEITRPFFICSNQFWQHKNHRLVLEAIKVLKDRNLNFQVVFTGKNFDFRNPEYFDELMAIVSKHQIEKYVKFLGFIDRKVQLCLAKHSISYIQPSLFEGWSTTVEDAKNLNRYVLLSDIPVHREQLTYNVTFFNPFNATDLAEKMETVIKGDIEREERNYATNILEFGKDLVAAFS